MTALGEPEAAERLEVVAIGCAGEQPEVIGAAACGGDREGSGSTRP